MTILQDFIESRRNWFKSLRDKDQLAYLKEISTASNKVVDSFNIQNDLLETVDRSLSKSVKDQELILNTVQDIKYYSSLNTKKELKLLTSMDRHLSKIEKHLKGLDVSSGFEPDFDLPSRGGKGKRTGRTRTSGTRVPKPVRGGSKIGKVLDAGSILAEELPAAKEPLKGAAKYWEKLKGLGGKLGGKTAAKLLPGVGAGLVLADSAVGAANVIGSDKTADTGRLVAKGALAFTGLGGTIGSFLVDPFVDKVNAMIENNPTWGDSIGRSVAAATALVSEDSREALVSDFKHQIVPKFSETVTDVSNSISDWGKSFGKFEKTLEDNIDALKEGGLKAWNTVKDTTNAVIDSVSNTAQNVSTAYQQGGISAATGALFSGTVGAGRNKLVTDKAFQWRDSTKQAISQASAAEGVDENFMKTMAYIESKGRTEATSSTGAKGLYQFVGGSAKRYGIYGKERDELANATAAARMAKDNAATLRKAGIEATPEMLYIAHQQGAGGAKQLVQAAQEGKSWDQLPASLQRNMAVNASKGLSAQQYLDKWKKQYATAQLKATGTVKSEGATAQQPEVQNNVQQLVSQKRPTKEQTVTEEPQIPIIRGKVAEEQKEVVEEPKFTILRGKIEEPVSHAGPIDQDISGEPKFTIRRGKIDEPVSSTQTGYGPKTSLPTEEPNIPIIRGSTVPIPRIANKEPEINQVQVTNLPEQQDQPKIPIERTGSHPSSIPTLDEIPLRIDDMGLVLLNIGHV